MINKKKLKKKRPKAKRSKYKGLQCGSNKEHRFLKECERNSWALPSKPARIETPYGYYTPDFEWQESYIEIKSGHTFAVMQGLKSYIPGLIQSDLQLKKIKWVSEHIKPIIIRIYYSYRETIPIVTIDEPGITIQIIGGFKKKIKKLKKK